MYFFITKLFANLNELEHYVYKKSFGIYPKLNFKLCILNFKPLFCALTHLFGLPKAFLTLQPHLPQQNL